MLKACITITALFPMVSLIDYKSKHIPSGKLSHNDEKSPFFMGKSTISMAIFNSKLLVYQRVFRCCLVASSLLLYCWVSPWHPVGLHLHCTRRIGWKLCIMISGYMKEDLIGMMV